MTVVNTIKQVARTDPEGSYRAAGLKTGFAKKGNKLLALCPFHDDEHPSFEINLTGKYVGRWACWACKRRGSIIDFVKELRKIPTDGEAVTKTAELLNINNGPVGAKPKAQAPAKPKPSSPDDKPPDTSSETVEKKVKAIPRNKPAQLHAILTAEKNSKHLDRFMKARGLTREMVNLAQIGFDAERYTIPVIYQGKLLDIRKYKLEAKSDERKFLPWIASDEKKGIIGSGVGNHVYGFDQVPDEPVLVLTEGELDCLRLTQEGIAAFSITNGAGCWPDDPPDLTGKTIIVCGDVDGAGRKMNEELPAKLYAAGAALVKVIAWLPGIEKDKPGFDVTDYFLERGTAKGFHELILTARTVRPPRRTSWTLKEFREAKFMPRPQIVPGILPVGLSVLGARPKVGKSLFLMQVAAAIITGGKCLGRDVEQGGAVLLILLEGDDEELQDRMEKQDWPREGPLDIEREWPLYADGGMDKLRDRLMAKDYYFVGIDTFARFVGGGLDQDKVGDVTQALDEMDHIGQSTGTNIMNVDHFNKMKAEDPVDALLGSTAKAAVPDTILGIYRRRGLANDLLRVQGRGMAELDLPVKLDWETLCWQAQIDEQGVAVDSVQSDVLDALEGLDGKATQSELATATGTDRSNVYRALQELVHLDIVVKGDREGHKVPYLLKNLDQCEELF